jgi:hypothetical protein
LFNDSTWIAWKSGEIYVARMGSNGPVLHGVAFKDHFQKKLTDLYGLLPDFVSNRKWKMFVFLISQKKNEES